MTSFDSFQLFWYCRGSILAGNLELRGLRHILVSIGKRMAKVQTAVRRALLPEVLLVLPNPDKPEPRILPLCAKIILKCLVIANSKGEIMLMRYVG